MDVGRRVSGSGAAEVAGKEPASSMAVIEDEQDEDEERGEGDYEDMEDDVRGGSASDDDSTDEEEDEEYEGSEGDDEFVQEEDDALVDDYKDGGEREASDDSGGFEDLDLMSYPEGEDAMDEDDASEGGAIDEDELPIGDHPAFGRYFKMLAVGLPEDAVWSKVLRDTAAGTSGLDLDEIKRDRELLEGARLTMNDLDVELSWREQLDALVAAEMGTDPEPKQQLGGIMAKMKMMSILMEEDDLEEDEADDDKEEHEAMKDLEEIEPSIEGKMVTKDELRGGDLEEVPAGAPDGEGEATIKRSSGVPLAAPQAPPVDDLNVPPAASEVSRGVETSGASDAPNGLTAAEIEVHADPKEEAEARDNVGGASATTPAALAGGAAEGTVREKTATKTQAQSSTAGSARLALMRGLARNKAGPSKASSLSGAELDALNTNEPAKEAPVSYIRESTRPHVPRRGLDRRKATSLMGSAPEFLDGDASSTSIAKSAVSPISTEQSEGSKAPEQSKAGASKEKPPTVAMVASIVQREPSSGKSKSKHSKQVVPQEKKSHKSKRKKLREKISKSEDLLKSSMRSTISKTKDGISMSEYSARSLRWQKEDKISRSENSSKSYRGRKEDETGRKEDEITRWENSLKSHRRKGDEISKSLTVAHSSHHGKRKGQDKPSWGSVSKAAEAKQRMKNRTMRASKARPTMRDSAMPTQDLRALLRKQRSGGTAKRGGVVSDGRAMSASQPKMMASQRIMGGKDKVMKASRALMIQQQLMQRSVSLRMPPEERPVLEQVEQLTPHQVLRRQYRSYKQVITENDDSLPNDVDAIDEITDDDNLYGDDEKHVMYNEVRMKMIEDGRTEMEIVAFFEGIALNDFTVRSLQSQIESLKSKNKTAATTMEMAMTTWAVRQRTTNINTELAAAKFASKGKFALMKKAQTAKKDTLEGLSATTNSAEAKTKALAAATALASVGNAEGNRGEMKEKTKEVNKDKARAADADSGGTKMEGGISTNLKAESGEKEGNKSGGDKLSAIPSKSDRRSKMKVDKDKVGSESIRKIIDSGNLSPETDRVLRELDEMRKLKDKLERQLNSAGIKIAEDIPYEEAKNKIQEIAKRMGEIGSSDVVHPDKEEQKRLREEYFTLEQDMEKYNAAMTSSDEYIQQQKDAEQKWEDDHLTENLQALKAIRRYMPVAVKRMSENDLCNIQTPNGNYLPKKFAKRFKRINVLGVLRVHPDDLTRLHPASLENYRVTGLTLTERRAIYHHIRPCGEVWTKNKSEPMSERKYNWFNMMRNNFKENLAKYERHVLQCGPPDNHSCTLIGNQCPIKADISQFHYKDDYGHPDGDVYEKSDVKKAEPEDSAGKAAREANEMAKEKKAAEREKELKKHYKKKLVECKKANGSCEAMDTSMDNMEFNTNQWVEKQLEKEGKPLDEEDKKKEIALYKEALNDLKLSVLGFAERSGMKISGAKGGKANPDKRSALECKLSEEVIAAFDVFSSDIEARMKEIEFEDKMTKTNISTLKGLLVELHEINQSTLKSLGVEKYEPERKIKRRKEVFVEMKKKQAEELAAADQNGGDDYGYAPPGGPPAMGGLLADISGRGRGGRGDLMGAIAGRGCGPGGGGRGDLMGAIAARGPGRGGGGRGNLMGAIAARGRGRGGGGRGDLMGAIAARGRGRGGGGRGDLMGAIAARGRGGRGGGGRGDLMGAIAARGRGGGAGRGGGGRSDLMGAIAARGRGGADRARGGGGGGRSDLMGAIAARGRGGGTGRGKGGRNDLLGAIAARGRGGRPGGGGGGRADLLGAIASRGRGGGDRDRGGGGGRADLMGAIAARGRGGGDEGRGGGGNRADLMGAIAARGQGGGDSQGGGGRSDLLSAIAARGQGGRGA